ncbi:hypothetical protein IQ268_13460 [Oculatella sp. LEGE 06141]|uniref:hypothetical protein n=1 Tax=Oculatella sp. LEGE 06141 TaxID=1828648 RepID=UPI00187F37EA|nr:hypothetical protein [Oculatella sp. LEGE 06141]MBE9179572.1 hypothetical protein [Oculatella sp. LEGE 06141]
MHTCQQTYSQQQRKWLQDLIQRELEDDQQICIKMSGRSPHGLEEALPSMLHHKLTTRIA